MDSPTSAVTQPEQQPPARLTPAQLWAEYVRRAWQGEAMTVNPRNGQPRRTANPLEWMAHTLSYAGYAAGEYTIRADDEWLAKWANLKLARQLGVELTLHARRHGIDRQMTVKFVSGPPKK